MTESRRKNGGWQDNRDMTLLRVRDLCLSAGHGTPLVHRLSFRVERGRTLGIVGESGSGKTITALSIVQLLSPVFIIRGQILFRPPGKKTVDLASLSSREIVPFRGRQISMIFQEPMTSLNPVLTCGCQIAEAVRLYHGLSGKAAYREVIRLMDRVRLPSPPRIYKSYPHQLSGGQRQRVMIAMAISGNPHLLIADEPTTALDTGVQKKILELLAELQKQHSLSMIFITHDLSVIQTIADHILVMQNGRPVESGPARNILKNPRQPYTRGLLSCQPHPDRKPRRLVTVEDFMTGRVPEDIPEKKPFRPDESAVPLLSVKGLKVSFSRPPSWFGKSPPPVPAVRDVGFEVYSGETLGLIGESGSGKTTLGRSLIRLVQPDSGEILFRGRDIHSLGGKELKNFRKSMQIIFQDPDASLNPGLTAGNALEEVLTVHGIGSTRGERKARALEILRRVRLGPGHYHRYPHELSGGQKQRLGIARALSVEPELIICDECVSALDVSIQANILNLLNDLKEGYGLTYIFISHDLAVVNYMSDRMLVMKDGELTGSV